MKIRCALFAFFFCCGLAFAASTVLERLEGCQFVPTEWADGDSFLVRTTKGEEFTVRLYGADCIEHHVTDATDARRLRAQRRYFGISEFGKSPQKSIDLAKSLGGEASKETARLLAKPFTIHTAYADARGDGKHKRIYAFVTTSDDADLAATLVSKGLARAFGVYRETPKGVSGATFREELADLELRAAKKGLGAWEHTDWDKLPFERGEQRSEEAETKLATDNAKREFSDPPLNANSAARDELMSIPGIGEVMANRIIESRPYKSLADLEKVDGIGEKTLARLAKYLVINDQP